jgi:serine phosphatase RsbU (regulator of sigma subunit)
MESAYIPATQVGGDFYHIRPDDAGGVLIAVGDVSGKGLRAAMAVSAIIGALRAMPILPPSRVLFDLNRGLTGNLGGGFVTCSVTHIAADGKMIIANAGHLPPYRNGIEIDCGFGLPLGVTTDSAAFAEHEVQLVPGDTLTLLTDGVVEARNATGELYGFDRTRQISHQSAAEIARTAQQFGQEDDITVLTLTRLAVGEKSPTERIAPVLTPA